MAKKTKPASLTYDEAAEQIGIGRRQLLNLIDGQHLELVTVQVESSATRITRESVEAYARRHRGPGRPRRDESKRGG